MGEEREGRGDPRPAGEAPPPGGIGGACGQLARHGGDRRGQRGRDEPATARRHAWKRRATGFRSGAAGGGVMRIRPTSRTSRTVGGSPSPDEGGQPRGWPGRHHRGDGLVAQMGGPRPLSLKR
jgi:hypothetical protein